MENDKLLPCPFCGSDRVDWWETDSVNHPYQIICFYCFNGTDKCSNKEDAIRRWNTRKPMERIVKQLEEDATCRDRLEGYIPKYKAIEIVKGDI